MKRFRIFLLVFALSGCTANQLLTNAPVLGSVCSAADATVVDEKVVLSAEILYNIPAQAYVTANNNKQLSPELKAKIKPLLKELYQYLGLVKAAKGSVNCDFASMKALHSEVMQLFPGK